MINLNNKEVKEISNRLDYQFGFKEKLDYLFYINNKNKLFLINKELSKIDLKRFNVNSLGLYFLQLYSI